jgi:hypothetical protein
LLAEIRRREGVVDDERDAVAPGHSRERRNVDEPVRGVRDRLGEQGAGFGADRRLPGIHIVDVVDERRADAEA